MRGEIFQSQYSINFVVQLTTNLLLKPGTLSFSVRFHTNSSKQAVSVSDVVIHMLSFTCIPQMY